MTLPTIARSRRSGKPLAIDVEALAVDDGRKVERGVARNAGAKASALEVTRNGAETPTWSPEPGSVRSPSRPVPERQL